MQFPLSHTAKRLNICCVYADVQMKIVMGVAVIMVILIIFLLICFGGGRSCVKRKQRTQTEVTQSSPPVVTDPVPAASPEPTGARRLLEELLTTVIHV